MALVYLICKALQASFLYLRFSMAKNRNLISNTTFNFKLRKRPSIFIGSYLILAAITIKFVISEFITNDSPLSFLTVNYLETFIFILTFLGVLFSLLAIFFGNRKHQRKIGFKLWNKNTKKSMWLVFLAITVLYFIEFYLLRIGEEIFIIPTFIISYGFLLILFNFSRIKILYQFSTASFIIGFLPLLVENFVFQTLIIFGISHLIFGFSNSISDEI